MSEDKYQYHPHQQQILALTSLIGVLVGALRAKEVLTEDDERHLFEFADTMMPENSDPLGPRLLSVARNAAAAIKGVKE